MEETIAGLTGSVTFSIALARPTEPDNTRLLEAHLVLMRATSPPEDVHALDIAALEAPGITFVAARSTNDELLGVGALKRLDEHHAELKSMHTALAARGLGVGRGIAEYRSDSPGPRGASESASKRGRCPTSSPPAASTSGWDSRCVRRMATIRTAQTASA